VSEPRESAVIIQVSLPPALERLRRAYVPVASLGVPAHVTLLYPFVEPDEISAAIVRGLRAVVASEPPFDIELSTTRTFPAEAPYPGTTYLEPTDPRPFIRLTAAIWAAFPDNPPFEGAYAEIVPHVTIADDAGRFEEVDAVARTQLPIRQRVVRAWLIVQGADRRWTRRARLALSAAAARGPHRGATSSRDRTGSGRST
jgi:2'-5' RNA ligase